MTRRLENRNAIVLGASQPGGAGWTIARMLAAEGARVAVAARRIDKVRELADEIGGLAFACDAGEEDQVAAFVAGTVAVTGGIDIAVAAVGMGTIGSIDETGQTALDEAFRTNFYGPFQFVRHATRHMGAGGSVTLFSSVTADHVLPGSVAYSCAKAAINSFAQYAAIEYAPRGIRVNSLKVGVLEGPQARRWRRAGMFDRFLSEVPLGAPVETEELARMVIWLATEAKSVTGESIYVDGGGHLRRQIFPGEMSEAGLESMGRRRTPE